MKNKINSFPLFLFLLLTCFFWLLIIQYLGIYQSTITPRNGVLSYTFNWWESTPFSNHLFLGNYIENEASHGTIYTTYTYPFYFVNYLLLSPIHHLFQISYEKLQNLLPYLNVLFFMIFILRIKRKEINDLLKSKNIFHQTWVFLIFGIIITNALPWVSMLRHNQENFHMFIAILFCYLSISLINNEENKKRDRRFLLVGFIISCLSPIYFPAWILGYIYSETELKIRKKMIINISIVVVSNIANYILPLFAANSLHLKSSASGYFYRSGLDGSTTYFDSILSVIYNPHSEQHTTSTLFLIASVIILGKKLKEQSKIFYKQLIFTSIPFCTVIILFPQFCSIHMYLIEFLLAIPAIFMLCYWLINTEYITSFQPKKYSLSVIFVTFIIMSQLLEIAKYFKLSHFLKEIIN